jgi:hypothetical protein
MDQSRLTQKIYAGYGKAALRLGSLCTLYRPATASNPISTGNVVTTVMAAFDTDPKFSFKAPSLYAKPTWYGLFDATPAAPGDYIVTPDGNTFFIASLEKTHPPLCISCNNIATFKRPDPHPPGDDFYGGDIRVQEDALMAGFPISCLQGTKGERGTTNLPGDVRSPWVSVLAPHIAGVTLRGADRMFDDQGRAWTLSSTELTSLGWRITAMQTET